MQLLFWPVAIALGLWALDEDEIEKSDNELVKKSRRHPKKRSVSKVEKTSNIIEKQM